MSMVQEKMYMDVDDVLYFLVALYLFVSNLSSLINIDLLSFYNGCIISRMIPSGSLK